MTSGGSQNQPRSVDTGGDEEKSTELRGLTGHVGPLEVDWPKAFGYYGGLTLAVALGLVEPPLGLFIAAVPFFKMLTRPDSSGAEWAVGEVLEGASSPVGGSATPVLRISSAKRGESTSSRNRVLNPIKGIWADAQTMARGNSPK